MHKLAKLLGVLAITAFSASSAFASSTVDFIFSYSTTSGFTLSDIEYQLNGAGPNLLTSLPAAFDGHHFSAGSGSISEILTVADPLTSYSSSFKVTPSLGTFSVTVSAVPLPASFPLFALALISLAAIGYHASRKARRGHETAAAQLVA